MTIPKIATVACIALALLAPTSAFARHHHRAHASIDANGNDSVTYLPHPAGCPAIRFCGCGAGHALGLSGWNYNLASNWPSHYHGSTPVAYWSHGHVAIIRQSYGDGTALLEDYNSGGHASRLHRRSIAGAQILGGGGAGAYASTEHSARRHRSHRHERYAVAESPAAPDVAIGVH